MIMIHFLRRIRRSLINTGSKRKYLLYAIGEILLVMIGILLALQVNNWNENQKDIKAENEALINLKLEFDRNQGRLKYIINLRQSQEKQCRTYLNLITDTTIPITKRNVASNINTNSESWGSTNTVLNSLFNSGGIDRIQNDSLKFRLTNWPVTIDLFKEAESYFIESIKAFKDYKNSIIPQSIVKEGNYKGEWPGNYYPPSMAKKLDPIRTELIDDIKYYNLIVDLTRTLYVYSIWTTQIRRDYERISRLIIDELKIRGIQI
jgi:hypothetical protein